MKTKLIILLAALALALGVATPAAYATTGQMTHAEFVWVHVPTGTEGIHTGTPIDKVDAHCSCTGDLVWIGTVAGDPAKEYDYDSPGDNIANVVYILADSGVYHAVTKVFCYPGGPCE